MRRIFLPLLIALCMLVGAGVDLRAAIPTVQAKSLYFTNVSQNQITVKWTKGNGTNRLVLARAAAAPSVNGINGEDYSQVVTANQAFDNAGNTLLNDAGEAITGTKVVYDGTGNSATVTGLSPGVTYYFMVVDYNIDAGKKDIKTSTALNNPRDKATLDAILTLTSEDASDKAFRFAWDAVDGTAWYEVSVATDAQFVDIVDFIDEADIGTSTEFVCDADALTAGTTYYYRARYYKNGVYSAWVTGDIPLQANIAPALTLTTPFAYSEGAAAVVDGTLVLADDNNKAFSEEQFKQSTVVITGGAEAEDALTANAAGYSATITGNGTASLTITPTGEYIPMSEMQAILRSITFVTGDNPTSGARTITWTITDINNLADGSAITTTVNVTPVNDPPTMTTMTAAVDAVNEDTEVEITYAEIAAQANEADPEGTALTFKLKSVSAGSTLKDAPGGDPVAVGTELASGESWFWTPAANANGALPAFEFVAYDGELESSPNMTATVTVSAVNDDPTFTVAEDATVAEDGDNATFTIANIDEGGGDDENGQVIAVTFVSTSDAAIAPEGSISIAYTGDGSGADAAGDAVITVNPLDNAYGTSTITVNVSDGTNTIPEAFLLTVTAVNDAPTLASATITGDPNAALAYTEQGAAAEILTDLVIADVDNDNISSATVSITAGGDNDDVLSVDLVTLTHNDIATATFVYPTLTIETIGGQVIPKADMQTILRAVKFENTTDDATAADRTVVFTINDGALASNTITRYIDYTAVNDVPTFTSLSGSVATGNEDTEIQISYANIAAQGDEADADGTTPMFKLKALTSGTLRATAGGDAVALNSTLAEGQSWYWTPDANANGAIAAFTIVAWDGTEESVAGPISASVTVNAVDDAPTYDAIASHTATVAEDGANATFTIANIDEGGGADENTQVITVTTVSCDNETLVPLGNITITYGPDAAGANDASGDATIDINPALNESGEANIVVKISDGNAANDITETFTVTVTAVNDAPTLAGAGGSFMYTEGDDATVIASNLDITDVDDTNIDAATISITANAHAADVLSVDLAALNLDDQATATFVSPTLTIGLVEGQTLSVLDMENILNHVKYVHTGDNPGTLTRTIQYQVNDGALASNSVTKDIAVAAVNDVPVFTAVTDFAGNEDEAVEITYANLLSKSTVSDPEGDAIQFRLIAISSGALYSDVTLETPVALNAHLAAAGTWYWVPAANVNGDNTAAFTLKAYDGSGVNADPVQVSVDITPVNDIPTLTAVTDFTTNEDVVLAIPYADLATKADDADVEGSTISFELIDKTGANGELYSDASCEAVVAPTARLATGGTWYWKPTANANGDDTPAFRIKAWDGSALSADPVQVSVDVAIVNDAPEISLGTSSFGFTEGDGVTPINVNSSISDVDDGNITGAEITLTNMQAGDVISVTNADGISADLVVDNVIHLSGTATRNQYAGVINSLTFNNTSDDPNLTERAFTVTVTDENSSAGSNGAQTSVAGNFTINVTAVNDAPSIVLGDDDHSYAENAGAVAINTGAVITDIDDDNMNGAVITLSNYQAAEDVISVTPAAGITADEVADGVITLSGSATKAAYQGVINTLTYTNTSNDPTAGARNFTLTVTDANSDGAGAETSAAVPFTVTVNAANDAPVLASSINGSALTYTEQEAAKAILSDITVADDDDTNIESATVTISGGGHASDVLDVDNAVIAANGAPTENFAGGVWSITGTVTKAQLQTILRALTFYNGDDNPTDADRTIEFVVNDGTDNSNTLIRTIDFTKTNDAPTWTSVDDFAATEDLYNELTYANLQTLAQGEADPELSTINFRITAVSTGTLYTVAAGPVYTPAVLPLTVSAGTTIAWKADANANGANINAFTMAAYDGELSSNEIVVKADVSEVNDTPTDIAIDDDTIDENIGTGVIAHLSVTDVESGSQTYTYSKVAGVGDTDNGLISVDNDGNISFVSSPNFEAKNSYSIRFSVTDDGTTNTVLDAQTYEEAIVITINDLNEAPTLASLSADLAVVQETPYDLTFEALSNLAVGTLDNVGGDGVNATDFLDQDAADHPDLTNITFKITAKSAGWTLKYGADNETGTVIADGDLPFEFTPTTGDGHLWVTPANGEAGPDRTGFTIQAYDGALTSAGTANVRFDIENLNDAPEWTTPNACNNFTTIAEDVTNSAGNLISNLIADGAGIVDPDDNAIKGVAIVSVIAPAGAGSWQFSKDNGATWTTFAANTDSSHAVHLLSNANNRIRFVPAANYYRCAAGDLKVGAIAWDQTNSKANGWIGALPPYDFRGEATAYSYEAKEFTLDVTSVNDAPVLAAVFNAGVAVSDEDVTTDGFAINTWLTAGSITDANDIKCDYTPLEGIAVTAVDNTHGTWEYYSAPLDGEMAVGGDWTAIGAVSGTSALLLRETDMIRFVPNANWNGTANISFRAWDRTSGSRYSKVNPTGDLAFSTNTETGTYTVNPVNDAPVIANLEGDVKGYTENAAPVATEQGGNASVTDVDNPANLNGAVLQIEITNNGLESDVLVLGGAMFADASGSLRWLTNGQIVGSYNTTDPQNIYFTFNDQATLATLTDMINNVFFYNIYDNPTDAERTITFTYNDNNGGIATATTTMNVTPVNDAPTLTALNPLTVNEDATQQVVNLEGITTGGVQIDGESQELTIEATSSDHSIVADPHVTYNSPDGTGTIEFTPIANASGTSTITVTVTDDNTAGGAAITTTRTFLFTVNAVNDAPTFAVINNENFDEDCGEKTINITGFDEGGLGTENAQGVASWTATSNHPEIVPNPTITNVDEEAGTATLTYTPVANAHGTATITVTVTDDGSNVAPNVNTFFRTFDIVINSVNDQPVWADLNDARGFTEVEDATAPVNRYINQGSTTLYQSFDGAIRSEGITATLSDVDSPNVTAGATLRISYVSGMEANDNMVFVGGDEIQVTGNTVSLDGNKFATIDETENGLNGAPLTLTFDGSWTPNAVASLLHRIGYYNYSDAFDDDKLTKQFSIVFNDNSGAGNAATVAATPSITITETNDRPYFDGLDDVRTFTEIQGVPPVDLRPIAAGQKAFYQSLNGWIYDNATGDNYAHLTDPDGNNIPAGASIEVTYNSGMVDSDNLTFTNDGIAVTDNDLTWNFNYHATIDGVKNGLNGAPLLITFTGANWTIDEARSVVHRLAYYNHSGDFDPDKLVKQFNIVFNDGSGAGNAASVPGTSQITVVPVNDAPTITAIDNITIAEDAAEQTVNMAGITNGGEAGQTITVTAASSNTDIIPNPTVTYTSPNATGTLKFTPVPNAYGTATITVTVTDNGSNVAPNDNVTTETFDVEVTPINDAPTALAASADNFDENIAGGATVATLSASDVEGDALTYSIVGGADAAAFTIAGAALKISASPDFEDKNSYAVRIRVTDNGTPNENMESDFTFNVNDLNEAPTAIVLSANTIAENSDANTVIGGLTVTDPDNEDGLGIQTHTYAIGGADAAFFNISGNNLRMTSPMNYEDGHGPAYNITITATDNDASPLSSAAIAFTVNVTNVNEAPTNLAAAPLTFAENINVATTYATLSATDVDAGTTLTYSIVGGADQAAFEIVGTSLKFLASPNFEAKNSYAVNVQVSDGALTQELPFTISITNVNEAPTDITINPDPTTFDENIAGGSTVATLGGSDPDAGAVLTYSLVPGVVNNNAFTIEGTNLKINAIPNYENQFEYTVRVQVSDGALTRNEDFTLTVNNLDEAPVMANEITNPALAWDTDHSPMLVQPDLTFSDEDAGATISKIEATFESGYQAGQDVLSANDNGGMFTITSGDNGKITITTGGAPTYNEWIAVAKSISFNNTSETPTETPDRVVRIMIYDDDNLTDYVDRTITVDDLNETPILATGVAPAVTYTENGAAQVVLPNIEVEDAEDNIVKAEVWISANREATDVLALAPADLANFNVTGDGSLASKYTITAKLPANETKAAFQAMLRGLTFGCMSDNPSTAVRTISFQVTDGGTPPHDGISNIVTNDVNVISVNDAPEADLVDNIEIDEDAGAQTVNLTGITAGGGESQTLTVTAASDDHNLFLDPTVTYTSPNGTASLVFTPIANAHGMTTVTVTVRDNGGTANGGDDETLLTFDVTVNSVNDEPNFAGDPASITIDEDATYTINLTGIDAGVAEEVAQVLTLTAAFSNANVAVTPSAIVGGAATISVVPDANWNGTGDLTITLSDDGGTANGGDDTKQVTIPVTVTAVNDNPTLTAIANPDAILEDAGLQTIALSGISEGPANESAQTLTITATSSQPTIIPNPTVNFVENAAAGTLTYTPVPNANGSAIITVHVEDNEGGIIERTFTVNVTAVNDAPTVDVAGNVVIDEDAGAQTVNLTGIAAGGDESQTLTVTAASSNHALIADPAVTYTSPNGTASLAFTPIANAHGEATITVTVSDNGGTANGGDDETSFTFDVTVNSVNDEPNFAGDPASITIDEDATYTINLTGIDAGVAEEVAQALTLTAAFSNANVAVTPSAIVGGAATISVVPDANWNGTGDLTITLSDDGGTANGGDDTKQVTIPVTVTAVNDAPVLAAGPFTLPAIDEDNDNSEGILVSALLGANVTDADGLNVTEGIAITGTGAIEGLWQYRLGAGDWTTIEEPNLTEIGPFHISAAEGNAIRFQPNTDENGAKTFTFRAWDATNAVADGSFEAIAGDGGITAYSAAERTATLTVTPINDEPNFAGDPASITIDEDASTVINLTGIDAGATNEVAQVLTLTATFSNANVAVTPSAIVGGAATISVVPDANWNGTGDLTITLSDDGGTANGGDDTKQVTIPVTVTAVNDNPTLTAIANPDAILEDAGLQTIALSGISEGPANESAQTLTITATSSQPTIIPNPTVSFVENAAAGTLTYTPVPNANGSAIITVHVEDNEGGIIERTFTVNVTAVNDAPTALARSADNFDENIAGGATVATLSASDVEGDALTYSIVGGADAAAFTIAGAALKISASPDFEVKSSYAVRIRVTDNGTPNENMESDFTFNVNDLNEAPTAIDLTNNSIEENNAANAVIGLLTVIDPDNADGEPLQTHTIVIGGADAAYFNISGNQLRMTNPMNYEAAHTPDYHITLTATDNGTPNLSTAPIDFVINVTDFNEPPTNLTVSVDNFDENVDINTVVATFHADDEETDNGTGSVSYMLVAGDGDTDNAAFTLNADGTLAINESPDHEAKNSYSIRVVAVDDAVNELEGAFTLTVNDLNEAPTDITLAPTAFDENINAGATVATLGGSDPDANTTLTYSFAAGDGLNDADNGAFTIDGTSLNINMGPNYEIQNSYSIRVSVSDGVLTREEDFTLTVNDVEENPTLTSINALNGTEDTELTITYDNLVAASNGLGDDDGDAVSFKYVATQNGTLSATSHGAALATDATLASGGTWYWNPVANENDETMAFTVRATDNGGLDNGADVQVTVNVAAVNDNPTLAVIIPNPVTILEDAGVQTMTLTGISAGPENESAQTLTFTVTSDNTDLIPNPAFNLYEGGTSGSLTFAPEGDAYGVANITVHVQDNEGGIVERTFTVSVNSVNDEPTITAHGDVTVDEDALMTTLTLAGISAGAANEEAEQTVTVSAVAGTPALFSQFDVAYVDGDGTATLTFTPAANANGSSLVTVTVNDGQGSNNITTTTFNINVTAVNDNPTLTAIANPDAINEDAGLQTIALSGISEGPANESDQTLLFAVTSNNTDLIPNPTLSFEENAATGNLTYTPVANANGSAVITVRATDNLGAFVERTFTVNVTAVNDAPDWTNPANLALNEGATTTVNITDVVTGPANESGQTIENRLVVSDNDKLTATIEGNVITLTANDHMSDNETANVTVTLTDDGANGGLNGDVNTASKTFQVTLNSINDVPTLTSIAALAGTEDTPLTITYDALKAASDIADEEDANPLFNVETVLGGGTLTKEGVPVATNTTLGAGESFVYTPALNSNGARNIFTVKAKDSDGDLSTTAAVAVNVNVAAVNDDPTLTTIETFTDAYQNVTYEITYDELKTAADEADVDGDVVNFVFTGNLDAGSSLQIDKGEGRVDVESNVTVLDADDIFYWTPATDDYGMIDAFTVKATDGTTNSATDVTVKINIEHFNTAPTDLALTNSSIDENVTGGTVVGDLTTTDADLMDTFTYALVDGDSAINNGIFDIVGSSLIVNGDNLINYEQNNKLYVRIRTTDQGGLYTEKGFELSVNDQNDAPTIAANATLANATEDQAYAITYDALKTALNAQDEDANSTLTFEVQSVTSGSLNSSTLANGGSIAWTPAANDNGSIAAFTVIANDGTATSNEAQVNVVVGAVNDAPVIVDLESTAATFEWDTQLVEGAPLTAALSIDDIDNPSITSATVKLTGDFNAGDVLNFASIHGIHSSWDNATKTLTLTEQATLAQYAEAIRTVKFTTNENRQETIGLEFKVYDGALWSAAATRDLTLVEGLATQPTVQVSALTATNTRSAKTTLNWTAGNGSKRIIVAREGSAVNFTPADRAIYNVQNSTTMDLATGEDVGSGNRIVFNGSSASPLTLTGLNANSTYHFAAFEYNDVGGAVNFLTTNPATVQTTTSKAATQLVILPIVDGDVINSGSNFNLNVQLRDELGNVAYPTTEKTFNLTLSGAKTELSTGSPTSVTFSMDETDKTMTALNYVAKYGDANVVLTLDDGLNGMAAATHTIDIRAAKPTNLEVGTALMFQPVAGKNLNVKWTINNIADGVRYLLVTKNGTADGSPTFVPQDGRNYAADTNYSSASVIVDNYRAIFNGVRTSSVWQKVTDIPQNTYFRWKLFTYYGDTEDTLTYSYNTANAAIVLNKTDGLKVGVESGVELSELAATSSERSVKLSWTTNREPNNLGFELYRSNENDYDNFELIGAYGSNTSLVSTGEKGGSYKFTDADPKLQTGKTYIYKLQAVLADGTKDELGIVDATVLDGASAEASLFVAEIAPNPVVDKVSTYFTLGGDRKVRVELLDMTGKLVMVPIEGQTFKAGERHAISFTMPKEAASGQYILSVTAGDEGIVAPFMYVK